MSDPTENPASSPAPTGDDHVPGPKKQRKRGLWARVKMNASELWIDNKILLFVSGFFLAFISAFFWNDIFRLVRSGEAGVMYRPLSNGTDTENTWDEGLRVVAPWNTLFIYNTRVQEVPDSFTVLSIDGLEVDIQVSIRFRPKRDDLGFLHRNIGPDYIENVVKPEIQAQFRFVLGQYKPEQIYTSQGFIVQTVKQGALAQLNERWVLLDDLLLKSVKLPKSVADSIEAKLRAQQLVEEYEYRNQAEKLEAIRKATEAQGIYDYKQKVTADGIDESFLRFRGIEATLQLAKSNNSKVIVIGGGQDGLPLILDGRTDGGLSTKILDADQDSQTQSPENKGEAVNPVSRP